MRTSSRKKPSSAGFTLLEVLVVTAIIGLTTVLALESFRTYIPRFELRQAARQTAQLVSKARLEAVKRGVTTVVEANFEARTLTAFAEINGTPSDPLATDARYLVYDPDLTKNADRTDYLIGAFELPGKEQTGAQFGGPIDGPRGGDSIAGLTAVSQGASDPNPRPPVLVFLSTGVVVAPGAFRLTDALGANHLEAAMSSLTGDVEIRKYLKVADIPSGTGAAFFADGNTSFTDGNVGANIWVWY